MSGNKTIAIIRNTVAVVKVKDVLSMLVFGAYRTKKPEIRNSM